MNPKLRLKKPRSPMFYFMIIGALAIVISALAKLGN